MPVLSDKWISKMAKEADISIIIGFTGGWKNPPALTEKQFIIEKLNDLSIQRNI